MKLLDTLLLYPAFALIIIGLHQVVTRGFADSYWILMLALMLLFGYQWRKARQQGASSTPPAPQRKSTSSKRKKQA